MLGVDKNDIALLVVNAGDDPDWIWYWAAAGESNDLFLKRDGEAQDEDEEAGNTDDDDADEINSDDNDDDADDYNKDDYNDEAKDDDKD